MPCRDWDGIPPLSELVNPELEILRMRNDELSNILCKTCKKLETFEYLRDVIDENPELKAWWKNHKAKDEAENKRLREKALAKLNDEDKKVLGLIK